MKSLVVTVPIPDKRLSPNARVSWHVLGPLKRQARGTAKVLTLRALNGDNAPRWAKAKAHVTFHWPSNRRRDPDNAMASLKATWDGIADAGIVANDSGIWPERPEFAVDTRNPRVVITLTEEKA